MIKIKEIEIVNYKSIRELSIPFDRNYGNSKTVFFLGINESGKSNILEAINQVEKHFHEVHFNDICHKSVQDEDDAYVEIYVRMEMQEINIRRLKNKIGAQFECFKENADKLTIGKDVIGNVYLDSQSEVGETYRLSIEIDDDFPFDQWKIEGEQVVPESNEGQSEEARITKDKLKGMLESFVENSFLAIPNVIYWKPSPEYLINEPVSLTEFKENLEISIPLRNIFYIYGKTNKDKIVKIIDGALESAERKSELEDKLSQKVTSHINAIWKEHKIAIKIKIDGDKLKIHIEDKDSKHNYYKMAQRSDGFKQFISLLLTLSSQYKGGVLKNKIILLDEPESHLHPSGVHFMRDEILKIGKDNHVFVATHSPSMVDLNSIGRHWIVKKNKMQTSILIDDVSEFDEEILRVAFGINMLNELLPKNLVFVEGDHDKRLLEHAFNFNFDKHKKTKIMVLSAGGASKLYPIAALLNQKSTSAFILCDSDNEGISCISQITQRLKPNFSERNALHLRNLEPTLPKKATIEDTLPRDFVLEFFDQKGYSTNDHNKDAPILSCMYSSNRNLKNDDVKQKQLKRDLIDTFIEQNQENGTIFSIAEKLIDRINED